MTIKCRISTRETLSGVQHGLVNGRTIFGGFMVAAIALSVAVWLWPMQAAAYNEEGGPIETTTAVSLFAAGIVALVRYSGIERLYIAVVCFLLAEREMEADIYVSDSLSFWALDTLDTVLDMTLVRIVLGVIVLGGLILHGIPKGWQAVKMRAPFIKVFLLAGALAVLAQVLEEVTQVPAFALSDVMAVRLFALEETLEMFFSIGIFASVLIGWPKRQIEESTHVPNTASAADLR